jgi:hypothetical protein
MFGTQDRRGDRTQQTEQQQSACQWHGRSADSERKRHDRGDIAQMRLSLRASTMVRVESVLREFAGWLAVNAPDVGCVADLRRTHIETYKLHLAIRPSARGGTLTKTSLAEHLGTLRTCFDRLTEWDGDDLPARVLVFCGDLPIRDEPLPRFLDDGAFTKLLQATRADPDPFVRLCVEFLARTGLRKGEFLDLTVDSVVQIGSAYWLHVPLGKLRNDRYIPLHPNSRTSSTSGSPADRPACAAPTCSSNTANASGRTASTGPWPRLPRRPESGTSARTACATPWPLRPSTAACRWMRMTMVYARIANRTVADEYFTVSEKVEALYDAPKTLPANAEGMEMTRLRREMHARMLGNGYCARPVGLDCHFESICESCTFRRATR